jgi:NAD(P)-dependent dehydrogenase (short-subunit alcohol dehydrogenase family)
MADEHVALIAGVGPGLGAALGRRFARQGFTVALAARKAAHLTPIVHEINEAGGAALPYALDATDETAVETMLDDIGRRFGAPELVVYNAGAFMRSSILEASAEDFERCWRIGCLGGFLVGRGAARRMSAEGRGTILFTGATASWRGGAGFFNLAVGKFGLRALAESMARELGPKGLHIAHIVIDGQIMSARYAHLARERPPDSLLDPDAIAETYWHLHCQPRSAWTFELELRPWAEKF